MKGWESPCTFDGSDGNLTDRVATAASADRNRQHVLGVRTNFPRTEIAGLVGRHLERKLAQLFARRFYDYTLEYFLFLALCDEPDV